MMKYLLAASLLANLVLSFLLVRRPEPPRQERLIIETHKEATPTVAPSATHLPSPDPVVQQSSTGDLVPAVPEEFREAGEKMETERLEFLTDELGLSEEKLMAHNRLREEFFLGDG